MMSIVCPGCFASKPRALADGWEFVNSVWKCPNCLHDIEQDLVIDHDDRDDDYVLDMVDFDYDDTM